jgi:hypothetical protein
LFDNHWCGDCLETAGAGRILLTVRRDTNRPDAFPGEIPDPATKASQLSSFLVSIFHLFKASRESYPSWLISGDKLTSPSRDRHRNHGILELTMEASDDRCDVLAVLRHLSQETGANLLGMPFPCPEGQVPLVGFGVPFFLNDTYTILHLYIYQSIYRSIHPSVYLSIYLSNLI